MQRLLFKIRQILYWFSQRSAFIVALLIFGVGVILIWYLVSDFSSSVGQSTLAIAVITTFFAAISAVANLLQAVEVQKERIDTLRPYIIFNFEGTSGGAIYFKIQNLANSPARDIVFEFNPAPIDHANRPLDQLSLFQHPISFLPPGGQIRQIIDAGHRFFNDERPIRFEITVRYLSVYSGAYSETIIHDLEYMKQATIPGRTLEESLDDLAKELKKINRRFQSISNSDSLRVEPRTQYVHRIENDFRRRHRGSIFKRIMTWFQKLRE
jgi:hypothetical protein